MLQLDVMLKNAEREILSATDMKKIEELKVQYLGKKGELTQVLRGMSALAPEDRPAAGKAANDAREKLNQLFSDAEKIISDKAVKERLYEERLDVTVPGRKQDIGHTHPLTQVIRKIENIFIGLGYQIAEGPEVESVHYNFDQLNAPDNHPSRDEQDTFYFDAEKLLRTQTSPVQARVMENNAPPIRIICPGRVYRADEVDATHSPIFHQIEALVVDKDITMGNLVATLKLFAKEMFGEETEVRLRPHYFPFTEPSAEVDVSCWVCKGKGCPVCKYEGFIEILGAGMVHPNVLRNCGIDPDIYSGFAFGLGVERTAMAVFGINDLRLFYENDARFLSQF
ncbi:MAG TPA: phenylalanine--tRNA ligase subunit alpha [Clostridia bacterium]|jgi:phenylalanyl-tRNA synthetase alpha chain|nr:phenylalanine--tRNA ligase subunit alpha [Clostridiaceae bacterium]HOT71351.1 phenylalanine--tRNA ligase subunit alpha [Clostridia bacterium]HQG00929.1 phenylalanine--tRNA ligase subunit alpha [Clostridia bacterium]HQH66080.1 phenylalanine--tRNA ligase subunit alpha [Clostridia bacterium]HQJ92783.1 phenylalanine--tRNA ligase subunit alpha [Clostridia bacterium]